MTTVEDTEPLQAPESKPSGTEAPKSDPAAPALGEHCVTDRSLSSRENPTGEITQLGGVDAYISKPSDYPQQPAKLLLLLTNGVGIQSQNNQLQADKFASKNFLVIMPDMFAGDTTSKTVSDPDAIPDDSTSTIEQLKLRAATIVTETAKSFTLDMWLARNTPEKILPILHKVIAEAKGEFADAISYGGGIYAVGYCVGGKYVLSLCSSPSPAPAQEPKDEEQGVAEAEAPLIKAGALAHGTLVTTEDFDAVRSPVSLICVENDQLFPDEIRQHGEKVLQENKVAHEIEVYPNVPHGFAVLGEYEDEKIQDAQDRAFAKMLGWIQSH